MPLNISSDFNSIEDLYKNYHEGKVIKLDLFKKRLNLFYYFSAKKEGFINAIKFFGIEENEVLILDKSEKLDYYKDDYFLYKVNGNKIIAVSKRIFSLNKNLGITIVSFLLETKPTDDLLQDAKYWKDKLGRIYSITNYENASKSILVSLERILDKRTAKNLIQIEEKDKEDIYCIMRWMLTFYDQLRKEDNMNLANKRIRLEEYLILPIILKWSESTYRIFNSKKVTLKRLEQIFSNIPPDFCLRRLVTNKLLRYINTVNTLDIFNGLKVTQTGDAGLGSLGSEISVKNRGFNDSYVNRLSLVAASASDPGSTMTIIPFVNMEKEYYFDAKVKHVTNYNIIE